MIAPLLGGVVLAKAGYNAVFEMTIGIISIDVALRLLVVEKAAAMVWLEVAEEPNQEAQQHDLEHNKGGEAVEDGDCSVETRPVTVKAGWSLHLPIIVRLLSSRRLCVALWASFAVGSIFAGLETVLPLQTHEAFGWNSSGAGLIFLPLTLPSFLGPLVGYLCDKYGPRWLMTAGFLFLCPILTLLRYVKSDSLGQKVLLCALLTLAACCLTLTLGPVMAEIAYVVAARAKKNPDASTGDRNQVYAQAFGLFNTAYSPGNTIGPVCGGLIKDAAGWATMSWVLGLFGAMTAIPVALWSGPPKVNNVH